MIKYVTWLILVVVLFLSIFTKFEITNGQIAIMIMLLLISLYPDLKEFNFWGIKGQKNERNLQKLEGKKALPETDITVDPKKLDEAEKTPGPIQLMDTSQGNFLALAFEIERLLRMFATISLAKDVPATQSLKKLSGELRSQDLLTDVGIQQIEAVQWLRNVLVHGRQNEINQNTLDAGIEVAYGLYSELYKQIYGQEPVLG